jgi:hypothetical protein
MLFAPDLMCRTRIGQWGVGGLSRVNESGKQNGSKWVLNESDCLSHHDGQDTLLMVCSRKLWCLDTCGTHLRMGITWNYWTLAVTQSNEWAIQIGHFISNEFKNFYGTFYGFGKFSRWKKLIFICFSVVKSVLSAENSSLLQNQKNKGNGPKYKKPLFSIIYTRHNPK